MNKHTAHDIADWFLAWAEHNNAPVTNLKLQKLLYYAQGHYLGEHGVPLFDDEIQAWTHGPVVPAIYHDLKQYGNGAINPDEAFNRAFDWDDYRDVEDDLMRVWNTYGQFEAWALRERTHTETPWRSAFEKDRKHIVIAQQSMRDYFKAA